MNWAILSKTRSQATVIKMLTDLGGDRFHWVPRRNQNILERACVRGLLYTLYIDPVLISAVEKNP
jgi:hypothetical protein